MKQAIGIPIEIGPAPFRANLFLYFYEEEYMLSVIYVQRFIDNLCTVNDGEKFGSFICNIYPKELKLKVGHQVEHGKFLNLDVFEGIFVYKLFDKRDIFPFSTGRMPHIESIITQNIFY